MKERIYCDQCKDNIIKGYRIEQDEYKEDVSIPCDCTIKYRLAEKLAYDLKDSGIPTIEYRLDKDYKGTQSLPEINKVKYIVKHFEKRFSDKLMYFYGDNGTQKTHVGWWLATALLKKGIRAKYVLMDKLIRDVSRLEDGEAFRDTYLDNDVIIMDESFDPTKVKIFRSGHQIPFLDNFIREFSDGRRKAIVFISNVKPEDIKEDIFQKSIKDFVNRKVKLSKTFLEFKDNYVHSTNEVDIENLWGDDD